MHPAEGADGGGGGGGGGDSWLVSPALEFPTLASASGEQGTSSVVLILDAPRSNPPGVVLSVGFLGVVAVSVAAASVAAVSVSVAVTACALCVSRWYDDAATPEVGTERPFVPAGMSPAKSMTGACSSSNTTIISAPCTPSKVNGILQVVFLVFMMAIIISGRG